MLGEVRLGQCSLRLGEVRLGQCSLRLGCLENC